MEVKGAEALIVTASVYFQMSQQLTIPVVPSYKTLFDLLKVIKTFESDLAGKTAKIACVFHKYRRMKIEEIQPFVKSKIYLYQYRDEQDIKNLSRN